MTSDKKDLSEVAVDSRGNRLYVGETEVGSRRYWSDEIGGGVHVWDTALVSPEMLRLALSVEAREQSAPEGWELVLQRLGEAMTEVAGLKAHVREIVTEIKIRDSVIGNLQDQLMKYDLGDVPLLTDDQKRQRDRVGRRIEINLKMGLTGTGHVEGRVVNFVSGDDGAILDVVVQGMITLDGPGPVDRDAKLMDDLVDPDAKLDPDLPY